MRVKVLLQITADDGAPGEIEEMASFRKSVERPEDLGLSLAERKAVPAAVQHRIVAAQTRRGPKGVAAAKRAAGPAAAKAKSVPYPLRRCTAGEPSAAPLSLPEGDGPATLCRLRTSSLIRSPPSASTRKRAGLRSFPTLRRLSC